MMMDKEFMQKIKRALRLYVEKVHSGKQLSAAKTLGVPAPTLNKWLKPETDSDKRDPSLTQIGPFLDTIGIKVVFPWENDLTDCRKCEEYKIQILQLEAQNKALMNVISNISTNNNKISADTGSEEGSSKEEQISYTLQNTGRKIA